MRLLVLGGSWFAGRALVESARPSGMRVLDQAVDGLDGSMHRHRATALIDRAEAHSGAGDFDAACDDALRALELVAQVQHAGNLARIDGVAARASSAAPARELGTRFG